MTYFFETYGCQMNIAESAAAEQMFIARGWTKADDVQKADAVIINTCSVRATAENRIFGRLGYFQGLKQLRSGDPKAKQKSLEIAAQYVKNGAKPLTVIVMGCMAERLLDSLKKDYPVIDYVVGTFAKGQFGKIIQEIETNSEPGELNDDIKYEFSSLSYEQGSFTSFVPIMHGCNNFCTYCIVPYVRGREVSRNLNEILNELDVLSGYGVKEITLLGQNVNSYHGNADGSDLDFPGLLTEICRHLDKTKSSIEWVRFVSSHPKDLSDRLIKVIAEENRLCHHIHLPVQHGSSRILKEMNRRYSREDYLALVERIKKEIPDVSLTTDIMIGFPGETEQDVELTLDLMKTVRYESAFMYYYNLRDGTPAATMENQIDVEEKKSRLQKIIDLQLVITSEEMAKRVGNVEKVLVQSVSRDNESELLGKTQRDESVVFLCDKSMIGKFVNVKLDVLNGNTFRGTIVN